MGNVLDKSCRENKNIFYVKIKLFSGNRSVYEIMSKNMVEREGATNDNTIRRMRIACWISKATREHALAHTNAPGNFYKNARKRAHTRTEKCVMIIAFHCNNGFANTTQCYVISTLSVFFVFSNSVHPIKKLKHGGNCYVASAPRCSRQFVVFVYLSNSATIERDKKFLRTPTLIQYFV